jgi:hypothetical protein
VAWRRHASRRGRRSAQCARRRQRCAGARGGGAGNAEGGKKGLLVNSTNICKSTNRAIADFTAQNGKVDDMTPAVGNGCGKKGGKGHGHRKRHKRRSAGG